MDTYMPTPSKKIYLNVDKDTGSKWFIHSNKHCNQSQSLITPADYHS